MSNSCWKLLKLKLTSDMTTSTHKIIIAARNCRKKEKRESVSTDLDRYCLPRACTASEINKSTKILSSSRRAFNELLSDSKTERNLIWNRAEVWNILINFKKFSLWIFYATEANLWNFNYSELCKRSGSGRRGKNSKTESELATGKRKFLFLWYFAIFTSPTI